MVVLFLTLAGLALFVAGDLVLRLLRVPFSADPIARLGVAMATGLCIVALFIQFSTWITWTPGSVRLVFACLMIGWVASVPWRRVFRPARARACRWYLLPAALLVVVAGLAIVQVRDAAVAPGVDSVHHLMLTRLIVDEGGLPGDLEPYIPEGRLAYHWGIHGNVAFSALLLGRVDPFDVSELIVQYAALLRIICTICMYAAARFLFADRVAGLIAGAITAGFSALPAALVTQGRFTHLAGVAVLAALLAVPCGRRRVAARAILVAILLAGLFLIHVRVAVFGIVWVATATLFAIPRLRRYAVVWGGIGLIAAAFLILPQISRLTADPLVHSMVEGTGYAQDQNRWTQRYVPAELVWLSHNGLLLSGATGGLTGVAGLGVSPAERVISAIWLFMVSFTAIRVTLSRRRKSRDSRRKSQPKGRSQPPMRMSPWRSLAIVAVWVVLSGSFLFVRGFGVDLTSVVPYAAALLTAFIPVILVLSGILGRVIALIAPSSPTVLAGIVLASCTASGIAQRDQYDVHSPVPEADQRAMRWIAEDVPPQAEFAIMVKPFHGIFVGQDAGYWIHVLTDRGSFLPPMIYGWVSPVQRVERTNELLRTWSTIHPDTSVTALQEAGVTHAYIGSTAHPQSRRIMRESSRFHIIYARDDVLIARLAARSLD